MIRPLSALFSTFVFLVSGISSATATESVYTKIELEAGCVFHSEYELGASAYCAGYKGYPVHFSEGDLRQMVRFGHVARLDGQWESFGQFNRTGDTVEWRLRNGVPYAAILRWYIENSNGEGAVDTSVEGQVLVISTVADHDNPVSCVVGYVDARANPSANAQAREIADQFAMTFRCGIDQAEFYGIRGPYSGDIVRSFD